MVFIDQNQQDQGGNIFLGASDTSGAAPTNAAAPTNSAIPTSPAGSSTGGSTTDTSGGAVPTSTGTSASAISTPQPATTSGGGTEPQLNFSPPPNSGAGTTTPAAAPGSSTTQTASSQPVHYAGLSSNPIPGAAPGGAIALAAGGAVPDPNDGSSVTNDLNQAMQTVNQLLIEGRRAAGIQNHGGDDTADSNMSDNASSRLTGYAGGGAIPAYDDGGEVDGSSGSDETGWRGMRVSQNVEDNRDSSALSKFVRKTANNAVGVAKKLTGQSDDDEFDDSAANSAMAKDASGYAKGGMVKGYDDGGDVTGDQADVTGSVPSAIPVSPTAPAAQEGAPAPTSSGTGMRQGSILDQLFGAYQGRQQPAQSAIPAGADQGVAMAPPGSQPSVAGGGPPAGADQGVAMAAAPNPEQDQVKQSLQDYLAGKGAPATATMAKIREMVDPGRQMPDAQAHPLVVQKAQQLAGKDGGLSAIQYMRQTVLGLTATSLAALDAGDMQSAARGATEAANYHLDGTPVSFLPMGDHVVATMQAGGQKQSVSLSLPQFKQYLQQGAMHIDAADQMGIGGYLSELAKQGGQAAPAGKDKSTPDWAEYAGPLVSLPGGSKVYQNLYAEAHRQHPWASQEGQRNALYNQLVEQMHSGQTSNKGGLSFEERKALAEQSAQAGQKRAETGANARIYGSDQATARSRERAQAQQQTAFMREHGLDARQADANARAIIANPAADPAEQEQAKQHVMERFHQAGGEFDHEGGDASVGAPRGAQKVRQQFTPTSVQAQPQQQVPLITPDAYPAWAQQNPGKPFKTSSGQIKYAPAGGQ